MMTIRRIPLRVLNASLIIIMVIMRVSKCLKCNIVTIDEDIGGKVIIIMVIMIVINMLEVEDFNF